MRKNNQSQRRPLPAFAALIACVCTLVSLGLQPAGADTYTGNNATRVNATIRPCFGMLLDAQLRTCGTQRHYQRSGSYGYYGHRSDASINCDTARPGYVEAVVKSIRPYGVLHLRARNRSCVASLDITRSITIVGQGYGGDRIPVLVAPDGQSCLRIAPTADHVIIKDAYISSPRGQQAACIEAANTELTLQNTEIRYQGDNAAVHLAGGRLNMTDGTHLVAKTRSVALAINNAALYAENSEIATTAGGLYAVLSGDSQILGVSVQQLADWHGFERGEGSIGMEIKLDSSGSILTMNDMKVMYFSDAINISGAGEALLSHTLISHSDHAITASLNRIRIIENTILSREVGVNINRGTAYIGRNQIAHIRTAGILAGRDGEIRAVDNDIDPDDSGCQTLQWGSLDPAQRVCTPWYKGSQFDVPGDANEQYLFDQFWPRMTASAEVEPKGKLGPAPLNGQPKGTP